MTEYRTLGPDAAHRERREQIVAQPVLFTKRIRLSLRALELLYVAVFCFVMTSLFLVSESFTAPLVTPTVTPVMFVLGVSCLLVAGVRIPRSSNRLENGSRLRPRTPCDRQGRLEGI